MIIFTDNELDYVKNEFLKVVDSDSVQISQEEKELLEDVKLVESDRINNLFSVWDNINSNEDTNRLFCDVV
jgi:hypothetical protein